MTRPAIRAHLAAAARTGRERARRSALSRKRQPVGGEAAHGAASDRVPPRTRRRRFARPGSCRRHRRAHHPSRRARNGRKASARAAGSPGGTSRRAGAGERFGDGAGVAGDDRQAVAGRLRCRHAEALVVRREDEDVGHPVEMRQCTGIDGAGDLDPPGEAEVGGKATKPPGVGGVAFRAHQQQPPGQARRRQSARSRTSWPLRGVRLPTHSSTGGASFRRRRPGSVQGQVDARTDDAHPLGGHAEVGQPGLRCGRW